MITKDKLWVERMIYLPNQHLYLLSTTMLYFRKLFAYNREWSTLQQQGGIFFLFCSLPNVYFLMDNTIDSQNCLTLTADCDSKHIRPDIHYIYYALKDYHHKRVLSCVHSDNRFFVWHIVWVNWNRNFSKLDIIN